MAAGVDCMWKVEDQVMWCNLGRAIFILVDNNRYDSGL